MIRGAAWSLLLLAGCSPSDRWDSVTLKVRKVRPSRSDDPLQFIVDLQIKGRDGLIKAEPTIALLAGQDTEINLGPTLSQGEPQREGCRISLRCDDRADESIRISLEIRELRGGKVVSSAPFLELLKDRETVTLER